MGTHPIFESDFDCLTDSIEMSEFNPVEVGLSADFRLISFTGLKG